MRRSEQGWMYGRSLLTGGAALALLAGPFMASVARAQGTCLDEFTTTTATQQILATDFPKNAVRAVSSVGPGIIRSAGMDPNDPNDAGERDVLITMTSTKNVNGEFVFEVTEQRAIASQTTGIRGTTVMTWDGNDGDAVNLDPVGLRAGGPTGLDLTVNGNVAFVLNIVFLDQATDFLFEVYTDGGFFSEFPFRADPVLFPQQFVIPFGAFQQVGGGPADFTNVGAVRLSVSDASDALDLSVEYFCASNVGNPAALGDFVWSDLNYDGLQDANEPGIAGVTVNLLDGTGTFLGSMVTDPNGLYLFDNLAPGDYIVEFVPPAGYTPSPMDQGADDAVDSDADPVTGRTAVTNLVDGERDLTLDAGMFQFASLGDFVWHDLDRDGMQDPNEPGIQGVTVQLFDGGGTQIATTTTDASGLYGFTLLVPGTYSVGFVPPARFVFSPQDQGADDAADSDADTGTGRTATTDLVVLENDLTLDAGLYQLLCSRSDGGFLWDLLEADFTTSPTDAIFTWRLTNTGPDPLIRADFRFVPSATVTSPVEPGTYVSPVVATRTYDVDQVGGAHAGVAFIAATEPLSMGETELFVYNATKAELSDATVLWNSVTTGNSTGRIDIRSSLCYATLPSVAGAAACFQDVGGGLWEVQVQWNVGPRAEGRLFQLYRLEPGQAEAIRVTAQPLRSDASGTVRFVDRCPAGAALGYRIEGVTHGGGPTEAPVQVSVQACAQSVGTPISWILLLAAALAMLALGLRNRGPRRQSAGGGAAWN